MKKTLPPHTSHPFLVVRQEQFATLQKKAAQSPWKEMKQDALIRFQTLQFCPNENYVLRCDSVRDITDAAALVYILEPSQRTQCVQKLLEMVQLWLPEVTGNLYDELYKTPGDHWVGAIPPGAAFVSCLLALDIMYNDLTKEQLFRCEQALTPIADNFNRNDENHMVAILGVRGLWALYKGQMEPLFAAWEAWKALFFSYITEDGVGVASVDYSVDRFVRGERMSKVILPIVMDITGIDTTFFKNPKTVQFAEWALGYTYTPAKRMWLIGDTLLATNMAAAESLLMVYNSARHSKKAAALAAWLQKGRRPQGKLLHYLLQNEPFLKAAAPESRIFASGGAWFYEDMNNTNSLAGVLWNSTTFDGHGHKEINSVSLSAFGHRLYANAGYSGWGSGSDEGFTWNYINRRALSASTVLVDYEYGSVFDPSETNDHQQKNGAGITEGFTTNTLCYALGDSGAALPNAVHHRAFVMVPGEENIPGYFLVLDSVSDGTTMTVVHRPFSCHVTACNEAEYIWHMEKANANLAIFLATPPEKIEWIDGVVADRATDTAQETLMFTHAGHKIKSLLASYPAKTTAATVLLPFQAASKKPHMVRTKTGMQLVYPNFEDWLLTNSSNHQNISWSGGLALVRKTAQLCKWFFAQRAQSFCCMGVGFYAEGPISLFFNGKTIAFTAQADTPFTLFTPTWSGTFTAKREPTVIKKDDAAKQG